MNKKRFATGVVVVALLGLVIEIGLSYPSNDPKGIRYGLWKLGFHTMDSDTAAWTMIGDPSRETIVVGKTRRQLQNRFGYLTPPTNASAYLRACYTSSHWKAKDVAFIRTSPWMIVFDGDRASELVLVKGC